MASKVAGDIRPEPSLPGEGMPDYQVCLTFED
jgi:hypothetical protein